MNLKNHRKKEILRDLGARFLSEESADSSLLTVTDVDMSEDGKHATILFTVLPAREQSQEQQRHQYE